MKLKNREWILSAKKAHHQGSAAETYAQTQKMNRKPEWYPEKIFLAKAVTQANRNNRWGAVTRIGSIKTAPDATYAPELQVIQCEHGWESTESRYWRCQTTHLLKIKIPGQIPPMPVGRFNHREETPSPPLTSLNVHWRSLQTNA